MEVFEGVEFVRLRSVEHGTYLHAAEDGRAVRLDARGASHHAAWAVQREQTGGTNWRHLPCRAGVAVGDDSYLGPTMKWAVEVIPWKHGQPEFPLARDSEWVKLFDRVCPLLAGLRRWLCGASHQREIRWVLADGSGKFREEDWASFQYSGRSAILLRSRLAHLTLEFCRLTMFIRAGRHGLLTPLVTDLPRGRERLDIVVLRADTRVADQLKLPDVDKETAEPAELGLMSGCP